MAEIASALGSTEQAVYARYADYAVRPANAAKHSWVGIG